MHRFAAARRDDHSSRPHLAMRLQQPTRGFSIQRGFRRWPERSALLCRNADSAGRASPPLLFGLAPRGVCHAGDITAAAVGSYPTFSPLPAREPCRHPEGFPPVCHRVTLRRRYLLCGTFRDAAAYATMSPGVTRRIALHPESHRLEGFTLAPQPQSYFFTRVKWCPDFPPVPACRGGFRPPLFARTSDHPAHPPA